MLIVVTWILVGAVVGAMLGGALGDASANHRGDIGAIFGGLVIGAALGAVCAGLAGRALNRKFPKGSPKRPWLVAGTWMTPLILVLVGWLFETVSTWDNLRPGGGSAWLIYEVSLPPEMSAPAATAVVTEFRTEKETRKQSFPGHGVDVERVGNRVVIKGSFETYRTAQRRAVRLRIGDDATHVFVLKLLPPRPPSGYAKGYSEWHGAEEVEEAGKPPRPPLPNEDLKIRYKMDV
jgi:phosphate/sulfate permease